MPSSQSCSKFALPTSPHCLNQEPPRAQQLTCPFLVVAHFGHAVPVPGLTGSGAGGGPVARMGAWGSVKHRAATSRSQEIKIQFVVSLPLHASVPSVHVCSNAVSPGSPHFLNQEPPRAQQLSVCDFLLIPHLGHFGLIGAVIT